MHQTQCIQCFRFLFFISTRKKEKFHPRLMTVQNTYLYLCLLFIIIRTKLPIYLKHCGVNDSIYRIRTHQATPISLKLTNITRNWKLIIFMWSFLKVLFYALKIVNDIYNERWVKSAWEREKKQKTQIEAMQRVLLSNVSIPFWLSGRVCL